MSCPLAQDMLTSVNECVFSFSPGHLNVPIPQHRQTHTHRLRECTCSQTHKQANTVGDANNRFAVCRLDVETRAHMRQRDAISARRSSSRGSSVRGTHGAHCSDSGLANHIQSINLLHTHRRYRKPVSTIWLSKRGDMRVLGYRQVIEFFHHQEITQAIQSNVHLCNAGQQEGRQRQRCAHQLIV